MNHDVGVHEEQDLTFRAHGTSVSRGARSRLVWEPHNLGAVPFGDGGARVCRGVVYHDDLEIRIR